MEIDKDRDREAGWAWTREDERGVDEREADACTTHKCTTHAWTREKRDDSAAHPSRHKTVRHTF